MSTQEITIPKKAIELIHDAINSQADFFLKEELEQAKKRMENAIKNYELAKSNWDKRDAELEEVKQWLAQFESITL